MIELLLIVVVLSLLIYLPALGGPPLWDDLTPFSDPGLKGANPLIFYVRWWRCSWLPQLRYLTTLSWAVNFRLVRQSLVQLQSFHLTNVLLHAGVAVGTVPISRALDLNEVIVALVVVAHPLAVSSTASIGQRASVLSTFFLVGAIDLVIAGWWPLAPVAIGLALLAKEDALGLLSLVALASKTCRARLAEIQSAKGIVDAGQSGTLTFWHHLPTALFGNCSRLFGWLAGVGYDIVYDADMTTLKPFKTVLSANIVLVGTFALLIAGGVWTVIAIAFVLSPFVLYWFLPLPHQVVDSRAYSLTILAGLAAAALNPPEWLVVAVISYLAIQSAKLSWRYESAERYWRSSRATAEVARLNLAATLQSVGKVAEAAVILNEIVMKRPEAGLAWANLGLIAEAEARQHWAAATAELARSGRKGEAFNRFVVALRKACALLERGRAENPLDPTIAMYHQKVHQVAKELLP